MCCFGRSLSIIGLHNAVLSTIPKLSGRVWLLEHLQISIFFVFTAIIEFTIVNYLQRVQLRVERAQAEAKRQAATCTSASKGATDDAPVAEVQLQEVSRRVMKIDRKLLNRSAQMPLRDEHLDIFMRYAYPIAFGIFLIWSHLQLPKQAAEMTCDPTALQTGPQLIIT